MNGLPLSVVIPTCNRPAQLSSCLEALAAQSLSSALFEVVVVDDGGESPAAPVAKSFSSRMNLRWVRQANAGPAAARNAGASLARGIWLAFTDDDCLPGPDWLSSLHLAFLKHPDALLGGLTFNAHSSNPYSAASQLIQDFVYGYYNAVPARARFFASNNLALPAASFAKVGQFDPAFRTSEDRDLCDRWLASSRQMVLVPTAVIFHAHRLTFASFWRQHLGYGRGARRFQLAHRSRSHDSSLEPAFYWSILRSLPRALYRHDTPFSMAALLASWQVANTAGWFLEVLQSRRPHASH